MLNEEIIKSLKKLFREQNIYSKKLKNKHGLNTSHIACLQEINKSGQQTLSRLCNSLVLSPSTLTSILDKLEKDNFIERHSNNNDKRQTTVKLLKKGEKFLETAPKIFEDKLREGILDLTEDEKNQFNQILLKILLEFRTQKGAEIPIKILKL